MKVTFWGACRTVTGSMHLLEAGGFRCLLDCGLSQGRRKESDALNRDLPFPAKSIDTVILSHAHIDHSGNLPSLVKNGYHGPIYSTPPTIDLCDAMLRDTAYIQQKDAEFINKRLTRRRAIEREPVEPIYSMEDAEATLPLFKPVVYHDVFDVGGGFRYEAYDTGHMLGSSSIVLQQNGTRLIFSGDVGRKNLPILRDPETMPQAHFLIMESTYGNRVHKHEEQVRDKLARVINATCARGGKIIVPAFAVGRTQQLVLELHQLADAERIPSIPIYVDSPLAINATEAYRRHAELFDSETREFLLGGEDPFGFRRLSYIREASESMKLNDVRTPFVVISASGMCEAGRILHHLRNSVEDPRNTILITGFQAESTLGRKLVEKEPEVRIFGELMRVRAEVATINELSGHADQNELLEWMRPITRGLKKVFLVHGEISQSEALAKLIEDKYGIPAVVPYRGQSFELTV
ncbi:MAG: MBL fold metallo-hydrolase RNA specificity domain-containing protein [Bryobacteraceae bacterium]